MREIKFRAWLINEKRMVTHTQEFIPLRVTNFGLEKLCYHSKDEYWSKVDELHELMKSTGLTDDNSIDIYDGDIFECEEHYYNFVEWNENALAWFCDGEFLADFSTIKKTIIGNIHQNPELLK